MAFNPTLYYANGVNVLSFGAVGDGSTDDQTAIQAAFDSVANTGRAVLFPAGKTFLHSNVVTATGCGALGYGDGSILKASTPTLSALALRGDSPFVANMKIDGSGVARSGSDSSCTIHADLTTGTFNIFNNLIVGAAGTGTKSNRGTGGYIGYNRVTGTYADGIHHTAGANNILVEYNEVYATGDDCISIVSYAKNGALYLPRCTNIRINNNNVHDSNGRGITVVGGENVFIGNNTITNLTSAAGVYIASEGSYDTYGCSAILIDSNKIYNCSSATSSPGYGSIHLYNGGGVKSIAGGSGGQELNSILIKNNRIKSYNNYWCLRTTGGYPIQAIIADNTILESTNIFQNANNSPGSDVRMRNNVIVS